jgi:hypothetical protein
MCTNNFLTRSVIGFPYNPDIFRYTYIGYTGNILTLKFVLPIIFAEYLPDSDISKNAMHKNHSI